MTICFGGERCWRSHSPHSRYLDGIGDVDENEIALVRTFPFVRDIRPVITVPTGRTVGESFPESGAGGEKGDIAYGNSFDQIDMVGATVFTIWVTVGREFSSRFLTADSIT